MYYCVIVSLRYFVIVLRMIGVDTVKEWSQTYRVKNYIGVDITNVGRHIVLLHNVTAIGLQTENTDVLSFSFRHV